MQNLQPAVLIGGYVRLAARRASVYTKSHEDVRHVKLGAAQQRVNIDVGCAGEYSFGGAKGILIEQIFL